MSVWRARRGRGIGEALELSESCIIAACEGYGMGVSIAWEGHGRGVIAA